MPRSPNRGKNSRAVLAALSGIQQSYNFCALVIGSAISQYRIVEKLGEGEIPKSNTAVRDLARQRSD